MAESAASDTDSEPRTSQNNLKYDRSFLLKLKWCKAARIKPSFLPNYPEVIIDKPNFADMEAEVHQEADLSEYTSNYKWIPRELSKPSVKTMKGADVKRREPSTSPMKAMTREIPDDKLDSNSLTFLQPTEVATHNVGIYPDKIFKVQEDLGKNLNVKDARKESQRKKIPHVTVLDDSKFAEPLVETTYGWNINELKSIKDNYSQNPRFEAKRNMNNDEKNDLEKVCLLDPHSEAMENKCVEGVQEERNCHEPPSREHTNSDMMTTPNLDELLLELRQAANKNTDINQVTTEQDENNMYKATELKDIDKLTELEHNQRNPSDDSKRRKLIDMFLNDDIPSIRKTEQTQSKEIDKPDENNSFQENRNEVFENENETLIDFEPVQSTREFTDETEIFCEPCEESNEKERAVHYCIECNDFLCLICSKVHRKSKLSRHHQLLDRDEMPREKGRGPDDEECVQHNGELRRFYCQNHRQTVCSVCLTLSHTNCNIDYIIHAANVFYESQEHRNLLTKLHDLTVTFQKQKTRSAANADIMNDECVRLVSEIETFRSSFDRLLDSMEIAAKTKAREICQKGTTELEKTSTTCSKIEKEIYDINSTLQKLGKYQMKQPLFIAAKRAEESIKGYENTVSGLSELSKLKKVKFVPRKELIDVLHSFETLGRIEIQSDENAHGDNQKPAEQTGILERHKKSNSKIEKVALMGIVGVKAQRDVENCWITGCVKIDSDSLAVVDRNNTCIKTVNINNNLITGYFKLLIPPWDITYTEDRELVVTCAQIILFIDLPTMKSTKEIKLGRCSYGIDYSQGKLFVTFDPPTPMLQILNTNGVVLKVIPVIKTGLPVVSRPIYISVADDGKTVAVADNLQVTCFNTETMGDTAAGLSLKSLGIAFGFNMEILITDESSGNICLWRPDKPKEAYALFQAERPQSLAFCRKTSLLYVSHLGPKSNVLSVFKVM